MKVSHQGATVELDVAADLGDDEIVQRALEALDLPRRDFQGAPLAWTLDSAGVLDASGAADIVDRRDQWLDELRGETTAEGPLYRGTLLALVERTGSRRAQVAELREQHPAASAPEMTPSGQRGHRFARMALPALGLIALVGLGGWWAASQAPDRPEAIDPRNGGFGEFGFDVEFAPEVGFEFGDGAERVLGDEIAVELESGETVEIEGEISEQREYDVYVLTLAEDDFVSITLDSLDGNIDTLLRVVDPDEQRFRENDDRGDGSLNSAVSFDAPIDGDYRVEVSDLGFFSTGPYLFVVSLES